MFDIVFIVSIVLLFILTYKNGALAKEKGLRQGLWVFITLCAYFAALVIGEMVVVFGFCKDLIDFNALSSHDPKTREAVSMQLAQAISGNSLYTFTIDMFGIGGCLLVRYVLEKKPGKKQPEIHWMDRVGQDDSQ